MSRILIRDATVLTMNPDDAILTPGDVVVDEDVFALLDRDALASAAHVGPVHAEVAVFDRDVLRKKLRKIAGAFERCEHREGACAWCYETSALVIDKEK